MINIGKVKICTADYEIIISDNIDVVYAVDDVQEKIYIAKSLTLFDMHTHLKSALIRAYFLELFGSTDMKLTMPSVVDIFGKHWSNLELIIEKGQSLLIDYIINFKILYSDM